MRTSFLLLLAAVGFVCLARPARAAEASHLFILSGQSNMRRPLPEIFRQCVSHVFGQDRVIVVTLGHPSQPIRRWYKNWSPPKGMAADDKPNGLLYDVLLARVRKAIEGKNLASVTFVWMQGEADAASGWGAVYARSFLGVLDQLKRDLKRDRICFVIGRINDHYLASNGVKDGDVVRAAQQKLGRDHPDGDWVDTDDLNTGVNPWGVYEIDGGHFPNTGYRVLGRRFARKACRLIDPDAKIDEAVFNEVFLGDASAVRSHLAMGKPITGTKPDAGRAGGASGLAALVDGKTAAGDHKDPNWLAFAPSTDGVELVVDLGRAVPLSGIAFDLLVDHGASAHLPKQILIGISTDGSQYKFLGRRGGGVTFYRHTVQRMRDKGFQPRSCFMLTELNEAEARYVKLCVKPDPSRKDWVYLDEIMINPVTGSAMPVR